MDGKNLFPGKLPGKSKNWISKVLLIIFFILGVISGLIALMYLTMEENKNSGGTVVGDGLDKAIGRLFLIVSGIFLFIAVSIYLHIRGKKKN